MWQHLEKEKKLNGKENAGKRLRLKSIGSKTFALDDIHPKQHFVHHLRRHFSLGPPFEPVRLLAKPFVKPL